MELTAIQLENGANSMVCRHMRQTISNAYSFSFSFLLNNRRERGRKCSLTNMQVCWNC